MAVGVSASTVIRISRKPASGGFQGQKGATTNDVEKIPNAAQSIIGLA